MRVVEQLHPRRSGRLEAYVDVMRALVLHEDVGRARLFVDAFRAAGARPQLARLRDVPGMAELCLALNKEDA